MDKFEIIRDYQAKAYTFHEYVLKAEREELISIKESKEYLDLLDAVYKLNSIGLTVEKVSKKEW